MSTSNSIYLTSGPLMSSDTLINYFNLFTLSSVFDHKANICLFGFFLKLFLNFKPIYVISRCDVYTFRFLKLRLVPALKITNNLKLKQEFSLLKIHSNSVPWSNALRHVFIIPNKCAIPNRLFSVLSNILYSWDFIFHCPWHKIAIVIFVDDCIHVWEKIIPNQFLKKSKSMFLNNFAFRLFRLVNFGMKKFNLQSVYENRCSVIPSLLHRTMFDFYAIVIFAWYNFISFFRSAFWSP